MLWDTDEKNDVTPKENIVKTEQNRCLDIPEDLIADIEEYYYYYIEYC